MSSNQAPYYKHITVGSMRKRWTIALLVTAISVVLLLTGGFKVPEAFATAADSAATGRMATTSGVTVTERVKVAKVYPFTPLTSHASVNLGTHPYVIISNIGGVVHRNVATICYPVARGPQALAAYAYLVQTGDFFGGMTGYLGQEDSALVDQGLYERAMLTGKRAVHQYDAVPICGNPQL